MPFDTVSVLAPAPSSLEAVLAEAEDLAAIARILGKHQSTTQRRLLASLNGAIGLA